MEKAKLEANFNCQMNVIQFVDLINRAGVAMKKLIHVCTSLYCSTAEAWLIINWTYDFMGAVIVGLICDGW